MPDWVLPVAVVAGATAAALGVALVFRRRERSRVRHGALDLSRLSAAVTLFTDVGCRRCDQTRAMLIEEGVEFEEFRFDHHPEVHRAVGVTGVPLLVVKGADGTEVGRIAGKATRRELRRLLARAR
jgi:glutaredoxin